MHSKEVPYEKLLSKMFQLNAGYFLIQCASEDDRESVYRCAASTRARTPTACRRSASWASINPLDPRSRPPSTSATSWCSASKYIPVERLGATDDCGFSPFSRDVKPKHGSPDFARDIAMQKIAARLEGAALAREALGSHRRSGFSARGCAPPCRRRRAAELIVT